MVSDSSNFDDSWWTFLLGAALENTQSTLLQNSCYQGPVYNKDLVQLLWFFLTRKPNPQASVVEAES
jgi:hypothetical protein